jgi:transcriptional regulator with XRE-family HTH domain
VGFNSFRFLKNVMNNLSTLKGVGFIMIIDLGKTIDFIRKGKNMSIKFLTNGVISRSQYHRIINNQSEISAVTFFKLLEQLNVSIEEFIFIGNSFKEDEFKQLFKNVKKTFLEKNTKKLETLKLYSLNLYERSLIEKYKHIYLVIELLIKRLNLNNDYIKDNEIQYYLLNLNFFTHYDLVLYINTYFSFSREVNELNV